MRALAVSSLLAFAGAACAQSWGVVGGSIRKEGLVSTLPGGVLPFADIATLGPNPGLGPDVYTIWHMAQLRNPQACGTGLARCVDSAFAGGRARVDASPTVIDAHMVARTSVDHTCPIECCLPWDNDAQLDQINFELTFNIGGVPPGTPVNVSWSSSALLSVFGRHESAMEDPIIFKMTGMRVSYLTGGGPMNDNLLTGTIPDVLDNPFNMTNTSKIQQIGDGTGGWFTVPAGTDITISLAIDEMSAHHEPEGGPIGPKPACPIGWSDGDGAELVAKVRLQLGSTTPPGLPGITPPNPFGPASLALEFSTDFGSDADLSEALNPPPGRPQFDPGDMYEWRGVPLPPGGSNGVRDDFLGLGMAGFVVEPDPGMPVLPPLCSFGPVPFIDFFDLDGFDALDFDLATLLANGAPPYTYFASNTVFEPDTILISADDDSAANYTQCDVPVTSLSPGLHTYGISSLNDEIMELDVFLPLGFVAGMSAATTTLPALNESDLHLGLRPNPDGFSEIFDDDTDALDVNWQAGYGSTWIFSVDHEATATHDPGAIYQTNGAGSLVLAATPLQLGLIPGADIDALELCWLPSPQGLVLAALFSVDEDDPMTPDDESSGLNPGTIYYSLFDNVAIEFAQWASGDDIDAIAVWHRSVVGTFTPCTGDIADSFGFFSPDGQIDFGDFLALLGLVGPCPGGIPGCIGDIADDFGTLNGGDGMVSFGDFLALLGLVGPCP